MGLFGGPRVIHERPRPPGVTAIAAFAVAFGLLVLLPPLLSLLGGSSGPSLPPLGAGLLLLLAGAGLIQRLRWALRLALGLALGGAVGSAAGFGLGLPLPLLGERSFWGWLLGLWYCLLAFFYLRQKRVAETF